MSKDKTEPNAAAIAASEAMKLDVRVYPAKDPKNNVIAYSSVTLNDCFAVTGIKLVDGEKGLFVAMPSSKDSRGGFRDTCFPITAELRSRIHESVLNGYAAEIGKRFDEKESLMGKIMNAVKAAKDTPAPEAAAGKDRPAKTAAAEL